MIQSKSVIRSKPGTRALDRAGSKNYDENQTFCILFIQEFFLFNKLILIDL
jgi:hypothetical protein